MRKRHRPMCKAEHPMEPLSKPEQGREVNQGSAAAQERGSPDLDKIGNMDETAFPKPTSIILVPEAAMAHQVHTPRIGAVRPVVDRRPGPIEGVRGRQRQESDSPSPPGIPTATYRPREVRRGGAVIHIRPRLL